MKTSELNQIRDRAKESTATLADIVEVTTSAFLSSSKHFVEIKQMIAATQETIKALTARLEQVERQTLSPIYQNIVDDENDWEELHQQMCALQEENSALKAPEA
jgi:rubrerythrin